jgi:hypothetical protein
MLSHFFIVQVFTIAVTTGHRLESRCDSIIVATHALFGLAFNSFISETRIIISNSSSIQNHVIAETGTIGVSPHQSSGVNQCSASCDFT